MGFWAAAAPYIVAGAASLGSQVLNWVQGDKRQDEANEEARNAAALDWERQKEGANTAWERSQQAAAEEFDRSIFLSDRAFGQSRLSAKEQREWAAEQARLAFDRSKNLYASRYQITMKDMRKAGLNPILAASGGFNVGSGITAPVASAGQAQAFQGRTSQARAPQATPQQARTFMHQTHPVDFTSSAKNIQSIFESAKDIEKKEAEIGNLLEQSDLAAKKGWHEVVKIAETRAKEGKLKAEEKNLLAQVKNTQRMFYKLAEEINLLEIIQEKENLTTKEKIENLNQIKANTAKVKELTRQLEYQSKQLRSYSAAYGGKLGIYLGYTKAISDALGINLGTIPHVILGRGRKR